MSVAALDLSITGTGYVTADGHVGHLNTPKRADFEGLDRIENIVESILYRFLSAGTRPGLVMVEGYAYGAANQAHQLGELGGIVRWELRRAGLNYVDVPPKCLKKFATGKGSGPKMAMVVAARERLGYEGLNDNEADAMWLRAAGFQLLGVPVLKMPKINVEGLASVARAYPSLFAPVMADVETGDKL